MKRVSITFLPFIPVFIQAQVVKKTSYTTIHDAYAAITHFFVKLLRDAFIVTLFLPAKYHRDITVFLTKSRQFFHSQTVI